MRDAYDVISGLHSTVNVLELQATHKFSELDRAIRNDCLPHPGDMTDLRLIMMLDALVLRKLAMKIDEMRSYLEMDSVVHLRAAE